MWQYIIGFVVGIIFLMIISKPISNIILNNRLRYVRKRIIKLGQNQGIALKECPFCGGATANMVADDMEDGTEVYKMVCDTELGGCGGSTQWCDNQLDAILLWNARPEDYKKFMTEGTQHEI